jgi:inositol 1,4,5-triphosphate receptor type 3
MIDYGIRSGGGIGDVLPMISYQREPTYFYGKFFYVVIFHIMVILVLGNVFLGIIVDTFADLRDKNQSKEDDKRFKCYICQISRDESLNKKIDFDRHCKVDHNVWNYVYFLTFLHITNPNDFNALQNEVWDCLSQKDISWIPLLGSE